MKNQPPSRYRLDDLCDVAISDTFLEVNVHDGKFGEPEVDRIIVTLDDLAKDHEYLVMVNAERSARLTFKGLMRLASSGAMKYAKAKAYVIHSLHQKIMGKVFLTFLDPKKPVGFFSSKKAARAWLEEVA